jgi:two-component system NarL family sensor kinase
VEIAVFRMVQECLGNVHRHSGSASCIVKVMPAKEQLRIEVTDWGRGIPESKQLTFPMSAGVGLRGLHERIQQLGGTLEINSNEHGTTVTAILPLAVASTKH